jgi:peptidoglycan/LPS O-acetylase OafA/YrhL
MPHTDETDPVIARMTDWTTDAATDAEPDHVPSKGLSVLMIIVGVLFLLPFILLSASGGPVSIQSFLAALLSVGWTFGLGMVFLLFGWSRLRTARAASAKEGPVTEIDR